MSPEKPLYGRCHPPENRPWDFIDDPFVSVVATKSITPQAILRLINVVFGFIYGIACLTAGTRLPMAGTSIGHDRDPAVFPGIVALDEDLINGG
jgi:hypothetical protein